MCDLLTAVALLCLCLLARQHAAAPTSAAACAPDDGPNGRLYWMDTSAEVGTWDQGKAYCNSLHGWAADVAKVDNEVQFALLKDLITKLVGGAAPALPYLSAVAAPAGLA